MTVEGKGGNRVTLKYLKLSMMEIVCKVILKTFFVPR